MIEPSYIYFKVTDGNHNFGVGLTVPESIQKQLIEFIETEFSKLQFEPHPESGGKVVNMDEVRIRSWAFCDFEFPPEDFLTEDEDES